jgi:uncharacterized membrane protein
MQNMNGKTALGLDSNVGAMLCYMPLCGVSLIYSIIVLITDKTNRTVRFHAFQSLLLTAAYIAVIFVVGLVGGGLAAAANSAILGGLTSLLYFGVIIVFLGLMIYGCVKAYQNQMFKLPVIGDMADKWS